jgi:hypothetical protein
MNHEINGKDAGFSGMVLFGKHKHFSFLSPRPDEFASLAHASTCPRFQQRKEGGGMAKPTDINANLDCRQAPTTRPLLDHTIPTEKIKSPHHRPTIRKLRGGRGGTKHIEHAPRENKTG